MNKIALYINGENAASRYGAYLDSSGLAALMTPPPLKDYIENDSALEDGVAIGGSPMMDKRSISLTLYLKANSDAQFLQRYADLCALFKNRAINISTSFQDGVVYRCRYQSCTQFSQFNGRMAKFALKLVEPNPNNRS